MGFVTAQLNRTTTEMATASCFEPQVERCSAALAAVGFDRGSWMKATAA
jgi:hypothetical protein